MTEVSALI